ncbi:hypothetical protein [Candidatus Cardinium sp. cByotN1]|uniref:hypothetical protein n=1 Tax=Candidatus Cardinium sp. cByotN1 TaxID=2699439 RepID=UPI001FB566A9|nr:hypothetical protein [Candidatus Cardinium sp. cByotN1]
MKRKTVAGRDCREVPVFSAVSEAFRNFFHQRLIFWVLFDQAKSSFKKFIFYQCKEQILLYLFKSVGNKMFLTYFFLDKKVSKKSSPG